MVLMTAEHEGVLYELEKRVIPGTEHWREKHHWYGVTMSNANGNRLLSKAYGTLDEALERIPLADIKPYVPYTTKDQRT